MRWIRHAWLQLLGVRRSFPAAVCADIEAEIARAEATHEGEICFAVEAAFELSQLCGRTTARQRALECFAQLGVWDTANNNGVLIYVLLAERSVEIVADRGIATRVDAQQWRERCAVVEQLFQRNEFAAGSREAIRGVAALLAQHFPRQSVRHNELPNQPILL